MDINDPVFLHRYRMYEDGRRDADSRVAAAAAAAVQNTNIANARGFKAQGVDPAIIASVTGLSLDEIEKL